MFEVYTKEVIIKVGDKEETYKLKPLLGRFYPKFSSLLTKLQKATINDSVDFEKLEPSTFGDAHELCVETLKKSYPNQNTEELEEFVSQNLFNLIPAPIEVNLNK